MIKEISVFVDEDIVYYPGAAQAIEKEFEAHPEADMLLFNMDVPADRAVPHGKRAAAFRCDDPASDAAG